MSNIVPDECVAVTITEDGGNGGNGGDGTATGIEPVHIVAGVSAIGAGIMLARNAGQ